MTSKEFRSLRTGTTVYSRTLGRGVVNDITPDSYGIVVEFDNSNVLTIAFENLSIWEFIEEKDPNPKTYKVGLDPKGASGAAKRQLQLLPPIFNSEVAASLADGASRYGLWNWRESDVEMMTYLGAMKRHIDDLLLGEWKTTDSKVTHLGAIAASCAIVLDANENGRLVDNRPKISEHPNNPILK